MDAALERAPRAVVDLSRVDSVDPAGLGALVAAANRAERAGRILTLRVSGGRVKRLLRLTGPHRRLPVEP
ncbi:MULTISPECIES: STAS domain-containing protein [unclassified Kitasatospora]|uniref:STAS domain-containing protein n=1 Tax=unclassified Kitasatospora TaxID=2633591 RepID=UPI0033E6CCC6